eukprot:1153363-Pelagomonas_calceolata.AAC.5
MPIKSGNNLVTASFVPLAMNPAFPLLRAASAVFNLVKSVSSKAEHTIPESYSGMTWLALCHD